MPGRFDRTQPLPDQTPPRLVPDEPFPPYAYVPGRGLPHPITDPAGHSHGRRDRGGSPLDASSWPGSHDYLLGIDLFNHQYFWEAHEAWESLWHAAGRHGATADFLKALIKLAAAGVKALEEVPAGTATHARRAGALWRAVACELGNPDEPYLGFRLDDLAALAEAIAEHGWPDSPLILRPR